MKSLRRSLNNSHGQNGQNGHGHGHGSGSSSGAPHHAYSNSQGNAMSMAAVTSPQGAGFPAGAAGVSDPTMPYTNPLARPSEKVAPPKKVIKALRNHRSTNPQELSYKQGDFWYVTGERDGWFEALSTYWFGHLATMASAHLDMTLTPAQTLLRARAVWFPRMTLKSLSRVVAKCLRGRRRRRRRPRLPSSNSELGPPCPPPHPADRPRPTLRVYRGIYILTIPPHSPFSARTPSQSASITLSQSGGQISPTAQMMVQPLSPQNAHHIPGLHGKKHQPYVSLNASGVVVVVFVSDTVSLGCTP